MYHPTGPTTGEYTASKREKGRVEDQHHMANSVGCIIANESS